MRRVRTALLSAALLAALWLADSAQAAFFGSNGKIAFQARAGGNPDADLEIYTINPDGTGLTNVTNSPGEDYDPSWSADGNYIVFVSRRGATNDPHVYWTRADGSSQTQVPYFGPGGGSPRFSADATEIAITRPDGIAAIAPDGASTRTFGSALSADSLSWGNSRLVYDHYDAATGQSDIYKVDFFGDNNMQLTSGPDWEEFPDWEPRFATRIVFQLYDPIGSRDGVYIMSHIGTEITPVPFTSNDGNPAYSPDGQKLVVEDASGGLSIVDVASGAHTTLTAIGRSPDWGPAARPRQPGYPRPKGATPIYVHLVPAYRKCFSPNRRHGAPLAVDSCSPPQESSDYLTMGTLDANGEPAKLLGSVRFDAHEGNPATTEDEADVAFSATMKDVRCKATFPTCEGGPLSDYAGKLQTTETLRIIDTYSGPPRPEFESGTVQDTIVLPFNFSCAPTADETVGSTCFVSSTLESITPGLVKEGVRSNWQVGKIQVLDGGPDGASPDESTIFATQGVFVP